MTYSTLRQYMKKGDLWGSIESLITVDFIEDSETLNKQQVLNYGDRVLFPPFEEVEIEETAQYIVNLYSDKWKMIIDSEISTINILGSGNKIVKTDVTQNVNNDGSNNTVNTVSAYNDNSLIDDNGVNSTNENTQVTTGSTTVNDSSVSFENLFNNLNYVQKTNIINIVLKDVAQYLTLQSY